MAKISLQTGAANGEAQYVKFVENIVVKLTENAMLFPDMDPTLADLQQALTTFKKAQADASYRDRRMVVIKNQALETLWLVVYHVSLFVERKANGDAAVILSAGFNPSRVGSVTLEAPPKPGNFSVEVRGDLSGTAVLKVNNMRSVLIYQFEYRKKNSSEEWQRVMSSRSKVSLTGLDPVQEYEFRVAYIGRNQTVNYSDIVSSYVF